ncbi:MAG: protein kinase [Acidobacteriota bacterium]
MKDPPLPEGLPEQVGGYRLQAKLGQGGMGEVYRAWDERLERPVALKRLRSDQDGDGERLRRRFRREARSVARVNHSAIVQIFEWIEGDSADWIVMEWVDGHSLRELIDRGPMPPAQVVRIGEQLAAGLEAAHQRGVLHRDLKAENVMLTSSGEARILDFGLAKRISRQDGVALSTRLTESQLSETWLSETRQVVGTVTAMSPEQALGQQVDARSDLFSLGVLLYLMLTGELPFTGETSIEVLTRICTVKPTPVRELRPTLPEDLAGTVEWLLQKDPAHRPQSAGQVFDALNAARQRLSNPAWQGTEEAAASRQAALASETALESETVVGGESLVAPVLARPARDSSEDLQRETQNSTAGRGRQATGGKRRWLLLLACVVLALAAVAFVFERLGGFARQPRLTYVVVPSTEIETDGEDEGALTLTASAVQAGVLRGLLAYRGIAALEPRGPAKAMDDALALARAMAADEVLTSRYECVGQLCQVVLQRLDGGDGRVLWSRRFTSPSDQLLPLSLAVAEQLRPGYPQAPLRPEVSEIPVSAEDYEAFLRLKEGYRQRRRYDDEELFDELARLQQAAPRFLPAYLLEAQVARNRFVESRQAEVLERARVAIDLAHRLAPDDARLLDEKFLLHLELGELDAAEAVLERLAEHEPGAAILLRHRALLLERRGRPEEAIASMQEAVRRRPGWQFHQSLADLYYRQGRLDGTRRSLETLLEVFPQHYDGVSRLAQLELLEGSLQRAVELYEALVARSPDVAELTNLGVTYLLMQRYDSAAAAFRRALEQSPDSPHALLNLADAEVLRGDQDAACGLFPTARGCSRRLTAAQ